MKLSKRFKILWNKTTQILVSFKNSILSNIGWLKLWIHSKISKAARNEKNNNMTISFKYFITQFHQSLSCNFWRVLPFITKYISYWSDLLVTSHAHMVDQYVCSGLKVGLGLHFSRFWRPCWYVVVTRSHTDQIDAQNVQIQN